MLSIVDSDYEGIMIGSDGRYYVKVINVDDREIELFPFESLEDALAFLEVNHE